MAKLDVLAVSILTGFVLQTVMYGIYLVLFVASQYSFRSRFANTLSSKKFDLTMFLGSIVLFLLITAHWIVQIVRFYSAFAWPRSQSSGQTYGVGEEEDLSKDLTKTALFVAEAVVGDALFVCRLYIVWNRSRTLMVIMGAALIGLLVSGIGMPTSLVHRPRPEAIADGPWVLVFFSLTLFINIAVTVLISLKIWRVSNVPELGRTSTMTRVIFIVMESAAVYTLCLLAACISYVTRPQVLYAFLDACSTAMGISFSLLIVLVGSRRDKNDAWPSSIKFKVGGSGPSEDMIAIPQAVKVPGELYRA